MTVSTEKLIDLLSEATGWDKKETASQLEQLVNAIKESVESGQAYELEKIGVFKKSGGELVFEPSEELSAEINYKYAGMKPIEIMEAHSKAGVDSGERKVEVKKEGEIEEESRKEGEKERKVDKSKVEESSDKENVTASDGKKEKVEKKPEAEKKSVQQASDEKQQKTGKEPGKREDKKGAEKKEKEPEKSVKESSKKEKEEVAQKAAEPKLSSEEKKKKAGEKPDQKKEEPGKKEPKKEDKPAAATAKKAQKPEIKESAAAKKKKRPEPAVAGKKKSKTVQAKSRNDSVLALVSTIAAIVIIGIGIYLIYYSMGRKRPGVNEETASQSQVEETVQQENANTEAASGASGMDGDGTDNGEDASQGTGEPEEPDSDQAAMASGMDTKEETETASESSQKRDKPEAEPKSEEPKPSKADDLDGSYEDLSTATYGLHGKPSSLGMKGYTIVIYSFSKEANAERNREKLEKQGYRVIVNKVVRESGNPIWRVGLGQFPSIRRTQEAIARLPEEFRENNFIKRIQRK